MKKYKVTKVFKHTETFEVEADGPEAARFMVIDSFREGKKEYMPLEIEVEEVKNEG